ncbi:ArsA family ATPase [Chloroflexota bacterium]
MFNGKGGVGKTTCSAATALYYASSGEKTLSISTDATPSLGHIFAVDGTQKPSRVSDNLYLNELGEVEVKEMWHGKFGREVYEVFSSLVDIDYETFGEFMTSVLPGLSDEFMVDYIREMSLKDCYEVIVWDTAPLGQTLALLQTPALLEKHLRMAPRVYSRLKLGRSSREPILDILKRWEKLSTENMEFLKGDVQLTIVIIPEALAVAQLEGILRELARYGLKVRQIIINNVIKAEDSAFLRSKAQQQRSYLEQIYRKCSGLPIMELPLFPYELSGMERLGEVAKMLYFEQ